MPKKSWKFGQVKWTKNGALYHFEKYQWAYQCFFNTNAWKKRITKHIKETCCQLKETGPQLSRLDSNRESPKNRDFHDFFVFCGRLRPALCCRAAAVRRRILNGCQKKTFEEVNRTFFQVPENPENYGPLKETLGVPVRGKFSNFLVPTFRIPSEMRTWKMSIFCRFCCPGKALPWNRRFSLVLR